MAKIKCLECGQEFEKTTGWNNKILYHMKQDHDIETDITKARKREGEWYKIIDQESESQSKESEKPEEDGEKEKTDLIERDLSNQKPSKGIFKEKPYPDKGEGEKKEIQGSAEVPESREVENELIQPESGHDLFGITKNMDKAKKWGGYTLVAGAIAASLYLSFRNYRSVSEMVDETNEAQSQSSQEEGDTGGDGGVKRNPAPKEKVNKGNGHKAEADRVYLTSEDV